MKNSVRDRSARSRIGKNREILRFLIEPILDLFAIRRHFVRLIDAALAVSALAR